MKVGSVARGRASIQSVVIKAAAAVVLAGSVAQAAPTFKPLALTGTDGALGPQLGTGVFFATVGTPSLNTSGDVAFLGTLSGTGVSTSNDQGSWTNIGGSIQPITRVGTDGLL